MKPATTITITIVITETPNEKEEPMDHDEMVRIFSEMLRAEFNRLDRREG